LFSARTKLAAGREGARDDGGGGGTRVDGGSGTR
jgi:hypothetical protein